MSPRIGDDGYYRLTRVAPAAAAGMDWLRQLPAVQRREQTWAQQERLTNGPARRLTPQERPPGGEWLRSPDDGDVRSGRQRQLEGVGYTVPVTDGCDDDRPPLLTDVHTAPAIEQDHQALVTIPGHLTRADLLPAEQFVAAGYLSAKRLLHSREAHGIALMGPVHSDPSWQARTPGALDVSQFSGAWQHERVTGPQGPYGVGWHPAQDATGAAVLQVLFACSSLSPSATPVPSAAPARMRERQDAA